MQVRKTNSVVTTDDEAVAVILAILARKPSAVLGGLPGHERNKTITELAEELGVVRAAKFSGNIDPFMTALLRVLAGANGKDPLVVLEDWAAEQLEGAQVRLA